MKNSNTYYLQSIQKKLDFFLNPKSIVIFSMTFISLLITSCTAVQTTYYKPIIKDGYYKGQSGGESNYGATRVNDNLVYFIKVRTNSNKLAIDNIKIEYRVNPKNILKLDSDTIHLIGNNYNIKIPIGTIHKDEWKKEEARLIRTQYTSSNELIGYPETNLPAFTFQLTEPQKWGTFYFEIEPPHYNGNELSIELPKMKLNNEVIEVQILKIKKVTEYNMIYI